MPITHIVTLDTVTKRPIRVFEDLHVRWSSERTHWDGLTIERYRLHGIDTPEFEIAEHTIAIQCSGRIEIEERIGKIYKKRLSNRGNIWLYPAGAPRQMRTHGTLEVLMATLTHDALCRSIVDGKGSSNLTLVENHKLQDAQIGHIVMALKEEVESGYGSGRIFGESLCLALSAHLVAKYSTWPQRSEVTTGGISPARLRRVMGFISENLASDLRLSDLAEIAGLSPFRFCHNFKRSTGLAPHQYIIQARVDLAKRLLRDTDAPLINIAYAVGCGTPSRFSTLFRRATGSTPSSYRASL